MNRAEPTRTQQEPTRTQHEPTTAQHEPTTAQQDLFSRGLIFANRDSFAKINPRESFENSRFAKINARENVDFRISKCSISSNFHCRAVTSIICYKYLRPAIQGLGSSGSTTKLGLWTSIQNPLNKTF